MMISTTFFSLLLVHIHLSHISFFVLFFSIPFAVSEQLVFFSLLFSTCQGSHSQVPHILSELYLLILHIFFWLYPDCVISIACKGKNHLNKSLKLSIIIIIIIEYN